MAKPIDPELLLLVIEHHARGSFEELFEYEWTDAEAFIQSAHDSGDSRRAGEGQGVVVNREGKTYRYRSSGLVVLVTESKKLSAGTARHKVVVLGDRDDHTAAMRSAVGTTFLIDEIPMESWDNTWEEIS